MKKVGMGVDFDPVHRGHIHLINEAKKHGKVYAYINEDYTAHHTPPFLSFEARREICESLGVEAVPVKGLHYRLPLSYTVPIRIHMMANDGITDIMDAAASFLPKEEIFKLAWKFAEKEMLMGIPREWPDRNLIRWIAANDLYGMKHKNKMGYHITPTYKIDNETVSGRYIRRVILQRDRITAPVRHLIPPQTEKIIERELREGNIPMGRDVDTLLHVANRYSKSKLLKLANINVEAAEKISMGRPYNDEEKLFYPLRRAGYQQVLSNLAISCMEKKVTRKDLAQLISNYSKKDITPKDQRIETLVERAYFVARASRLIDAPVADSIFRAGIDDFWDENFKEIVSLSGTDEKTIRDLRKKMPYEQPPENLLAGVALKFDDFKKIHEDTICDLTSSGSDIMAEFRMPKVVVHGKLKLPAVEVTFLRYLLDSQLVPVSCKAEDVEGKLRIRILYGLEI